MALSSPYPIVLPPSPVHDPLGYNGTFLYILQILSLWNPLPHFFTAQTPPPNSVRFKVELLFLVIVCFCIEWLPILLIFHIWSISANNNCTDNPIKNHFNTYGYRKLKKLRMCIFSCKQDICISKKYNKVINKKCFCIKILHQDKIFWGREHLGGMVT